LALVLMWVAAQVPPQVFMRYALPVFVLVLVMLAGVALFGDVRNGARRWLPLGFASVHPRAHEVAMPLMLARYFHRHEAALRLREYVSPSCSSGADRDDRAPARSGHGAAGRSRRLLVIFLAGLSWKVIAGGSAVVLASLRCCGASARLPAQAFLTLIDPSSDPLGAGYHIIQSTIAVGSGASQARLAGGHPDAPRIHSRARHRFYFRVYSEEFGLIGASLLLVLYSRSSCAG